MAAKFPYTYLSCPCSDQSQRLHNLNRSSQEGEIHDASQDSKEALDPRDPRSAFSLLPPEHLLYCEECHDIKCSRCVTEEIICTYCPGCLFEVPTSSVKQDYNRCSRNCFNCPICMSQLITTTAGEKDEGPWILSCSYCMWTSLEIGIKLAQASGIRTQMDHLANGGASKASYRDGTAMKGIRSALSREVERGSRETLKASPFGKQDSRADADVGTSLESHACFEALKSFYKDQIATASFPTGMVTGLDSLSSPSSLSRIMSLYASSGSSSAKTSKIRPTPMREANTPSEGLRIASLDRFEEVGHDNPIDRPTTKQLLFQHPYPIGNPEAKHVSELRPMPTLLRTKRSKRCAACKHILVKPEFKVTSTRYRIKLIALNYIPFVTVKPVPVPGGIKAAGPDGANIILEPGKPSQWILTLRNPLFENLSVSLGSPNVTPGKLGHKVTILCPQFHIGKNGDVWDDALNANVAQTIMSPSGGEHTAGKIHDSGRNWTSVVIEVVPVGVSPEQVDGLEEGEDVIEIPVRVRLEWAISEEENDAVSGGNRDRVLDDGVEDGKRELAYWMVLGIGRVAR